MNDRITISRNSALLLYGASISQLTKTEYGKKVLEELLSAIENVDVKKERPAISKSKVCICGGDPLCACSRLS